MSIALCITSRYVTTASDQLRPAPFEGDMLNGNSPIHLPETRIRVYNQQRHLLNAEYSSLFMQVPDIMRQYRNAFSRKQSSTNQSADRA